MKHCFIALSAFGLIAAASPATAAISFTSTDFGFTEAGASTITFDAAIPTGFTLIGGLVQSGSNGFGAAPATAQGVKETTNYLTANAGDAATITAATGYRDVSFYWGSIDRYNTVSLLDAKGGTIGSYTGDQIFMPADGNQLEASTNRQVTFSTNGGTPAIYGIRFASTQPAFEVDNVSFGGAVPEPATWAMMIGGIGVSGGAMRRRRHRGSGVAFA